MTRFLLLFGGLAGGCSLFRVVVPGGGGGGGNPPLPETATPSWVPEIGAALGAAAAIGAATWWRKRKRKNK